jgi:hypothetical protein
MLISTTSPILRSPLREPRPLIACCKTFESVVEMLAFGPTLFSAPDPMVFNSLSPVSKLVVFELASMIYNTYGPVGVKELLFKALESTGHLKVQGTENQT